MTHIQDVLDPNLIQSVRDVVARQLTPTITVEACSCEPHTGSFVNLPSTTLVVHDCGKPKPRALAMFRPQYEAMLAEGITVTSLAPARVMSEPPLSRFLTPRGPGPNPADTLTVSYMGMTAGEADALEVALAEPPKVIEPLAKVVQQVAVLDGEAPARNPKVDALMTACPHLSEEQAREMVASL